MTEAAPPPPIEVLIDLAIRLVNAGDRERAWLLCEQAAETHRPHPAVQQLLAVLGLQRGRLEDAARHADASLALRPEHAPTLGVAVEAWFRLALQRHDERRLDAAAEALRRVLTLRPGHAEAWVNLGIVLQDAGDVDRAFGCYGQAYRLRADCFGRVAHALAAGNAGRLFLDLASLRAALENAPLPR